MTTATTASRTTATVPALAHGYDPIELWYYQYMIPGMFQRLRQDTCGKITNVESEAQKQSGPCAGTRVIYYVLVYTGTRYTTKNTRPTHIYYTRYITLSEIIKTACVFILRTKRPWHFQTEWCAPVVHERLNIKKNACWREPLYMKRWRLC